MFKEYRCRRSQHRNTLSGRERWTEYERRKAILANTARSSAEYEAGIRRICDELGI